MAEAAPTIEYAPLTPEQSQVNELYKQLWRAEITKNSWAEDSQEARQLKEQLRTQMHAQFPTLFAQRQAAPQSPFANHSNVGVPNPTAIELQRFEAIYKQTNERVAKLVKDRLGSELLRVNDRHPTTNAYLEHLGIDVGMLQSGSALSQDVINKHQLNMEENRRSWEKIKSNTKWSLGIGIGLSVFTGGAGLVATAAGIGASFLVRRGIHYYRAWDPFKQREKTEFKLRLQAAEVEVKKGNEAIKLAQELDKLSRTTLSQPGGNTLENRLAYLKLAESLMNILDDREKSLPEKPGTYRNAAEKELAEYQKSVDTTEAWLSGIAGFAGGVGAGVAVAKAHLAGEGAKQAAIQAKMKAAQETGTTIAGTTTVVGPHGALQHGSAIERAIQWVNNAWHPVLKASEVAAGSAEVTKVSAAEAVKHGSSGMANFGFEQLSKSGVESVITQASADPIHKSTLDWAAKVLTERFGAEAAQELAQKVYVNAAKLFGQMLIASGVGAYMGYRAGERSIDAERRTTERGAVHSDEFASLYEQSRQDLPVVTLSDLIHSELDRLEPKLATETAAAATAAGSPEVGAAPRAITPNDLYDLGDDMWDVEPITNLVHTFKTVMKPRKLKILRPGDTQGKTWVVEAWANINDDTSTRGEVATISTDYLNQILHHPGSPAKQMDPNAMTPEEAAILEKPGKIKNELDRAEKALAETPPREVKLVPNQPLKSDAIDPDIPPDADIYVEEINLKKPRPIIRIRYNKNGTNTFKELRVSEVITKVFELKPTPTASNQPEAEKKNTVDEKVIKEKIEERKRAKTGLNGPPGSKIEDGQVYEIKNKQYIIKSIVGEKVELQEVKVDASTGRPEITAGKGGGKTNKVTPEDKAYPDEKLILDLINQYDHFVGDRYTL